MSGLLCDLLWIFATLFGITYGRFAVNEISPGEFWICLTLLYVGGQWILDRRANIVIDQRDIDRAVKDYLDGNDE